MHQLYLPLINLFEIPYAITLQIILFKQRKNNLQFDGNQMKTNVHEPMTMPKVVNMMLYGRYNQENIRSYEFLVQPKLHSYRLLYDDDHPIEYWLLQLLYEHST